MCLQLSYLMWCGELRFHAVSLRMQYLGFYNCRSLKHIAISFWKHYYFLGFSVASLKLSVCFAACISDVKSCLFTMNSYKSSKLHSLHEL